MRRLIATKRARRFELAISETINVKNFVDHEPNRFVLGAFREKHARLAIECAFRKFEAPSQIDDRDEFSAHADHTENRTRRTRDGREWRQAQDLSDRVDAKRVLLASEKKAQILGEA